MIRPRGSAKVPVMASTVNHQPSSYQPFVAITELGGDFYDGVRAADFPKHLLRFRNQPWAERVGLGHLGDEDWIRHFGRFEPLPGNMAVPLALRYHGHQFRSYNPDLGDGRGFLFAQFRDPKDARLLDLGTKGSGQTPYSRSGDGRLTLKGSVREALATEMLESLGVYTSKTFSVIETGERLERNDEPSPTRSAVLVRLNHGHIRFGTFQRQAFFGRADNLKKLVEYCIRHYYPEIESQDEAERPAAFLAAVTERSADLCASWMMAGFVHGVLNTDNMNVTGESFDYGPYRFTPTYNPAFTAAYFDHTGLYAYGRQPESVLWNLEQLASCLALISEKEPLIEALQLFAPRFNDSVVDRFIERMGVRKGDQEENAAFFMAAFDFLAESQVTFEQFFHDWYGGRLSRERALRSPEVNLYKGERYEMFVREAEARVPDASAEKRLKDAYFQKPKPCSLLIDEIESIWDAIDQKDDWSVFDRKISEIRSMGRVHGRRDI
jgi:serine/tyrosine/threonine adenylyltransferase